MIISYKRVEAGAMGILDEVVCKQLNDYSNLTLAQWKEVASLIYKTDPYIYPAMFTSVKEAVMVIPELMQKKDKMFCPQNIYAVSDKDGVIVGIILWIEGPLKWDSKDFVTCLQELGIHPSRYLDDVKTRYLSGYSKMPENTISIINVCVKEGFQGKGVGGKMMMSFLAEHQEPGKVFELFVLKDNPAAIRLYTNQGFEVQNEQRGFSADKRDIYCYRMARKA